MNKYCVKCGEVLETGAAFCSKCGAKTISSDIQSTTTPTVESTDSNGIAIAGFVCALLGVNVVGLILSIIGLSNAKKANGKNKGLALAGVIISAARMAFSFIFSIFLIFFSTVKTTVSNQWENENLKPVSAYTEKVIY